MVKGVEGNDSMRRKFEQMLREAQNKICSAVEELDGEGTFRQDVWERENGGGGISRVMAGGKVWEKAGCSLSVVYGSMPQEALASVTPANYVLSQLQLLLTELTWIVLT